MDFAAFEPLYGAVPYEVLSHSPDGSLIVMQVIARLTTMMRGEVLSGKKPQDSLPGRQKIPSRSPGSLMDKKLD
jgi:hypothetical protein